jgi:hypothetical protein
MVRRNNANVDFIPAAGDLTLIWDTLVKQVGLLLSHSAGVFSLGETGRFLIMWSDHVNNPNTNNNRSTWESRLNFAGSDIIGGSNTGYIRRNGDTTDYIICGVAIVEVTTLIGNGDEIFVHHIRDDSSANETVVRTGNSRSGITIIKLDDAWGYGRYLTATPVTASATLNASTTLDLETTVQEDPPFIRTGDSIEITTPNPVLAIFSMRVETQNTGGRAESQMRLNLAGSIVPGSWAQVYGPRNQQNTNQAACSGMCLLFPDPGDDLTLEIVTRMLGGDDWEASLDLIELPAGAQSCLVEATSGLFNEAVAAGFAWDTLEQIDEDAFTHVAGNENIDVDDPGDYLVMANQAIISDAGSGPIRGCPSIQFRVNAVNDEAAGSSTYHRDEGHTADHGAINVAALLTDLLPDDEIRVWNDSAFSQNTGTMAVGAGAFAAIRLASLFPRRPRPIIRSQAMNRAAHF